MNLIRCQFKEAENCFDLNISSGQYGTGIYAMKSNAISLIDYYSKNGEDIYRFKIDDRCVYDLSKNKIDYWEAKTFIYNNPQFKAFIFQHKGYGIPTGKQILITDPKIINNLKKQCNHE